MISPRRKLPPLNALRAFEASGRNLNFRAAADELGVTQGAVAQQVRALESHLGLTLFQRLARGLALTPAGAAYLTDITRAFDLLTESTNQLLVRPEIVTVSVTPTFATKLLIPSLAELHAAFPGIELRTVATESLSDFDHDQVDIAIRLTDKPFSADLEAKLLFHQELVVVASPHIVRDTHLPLSMAQLMTLPLLHDAHDYWRKIFPASSSRSGLAFNQTTLALDAALAGQGVALACRSFVAKDLEAGRLLQVMNETTVIKPSYFLVRKRSKITRKAVDDIWHWLTERFSQH